MMVLAAKLAPIFWNTPLLSELFSPGLYSTLVSDLTGIPLP